MRREILPKPQHMKKTIIANKIDKSFVYRLLWGSIADQM